MSESSKYFYIRVQGDRALFTNPATKGGGEKYSYDVPTRQALKGIVDNIYRKPTFINVVDEVKVINSIQRESHGTRALLNNYTADLSFSTYLTKVEYLIKFHFIWDITQKDLEEDRIMKKHENIMERSIELGGRRDSFLGTRECFATVEGISQGEYITSHSYYEGTTKALGYMFHSFSYPAKPKEQLKANYAQTTMIDGVITFKKKSECEFSNLIPSYRQQTPIHKPRSVNDEYAIYQNY